jgi:uncharacterized protein
MARRLILAMIGFYRAAVSPWLGPACRFTPSCSAYAEEAVREHGAARGSWLAAKRLLRCHPWGDSGFDPVPRRPGAAAPQHRRENDFDG